MRSGRKGLVVAIAALTALAMVTSGCGKSAASGSGSEKTIKIGIGAPLTAGTVAIGQGIERGAQLAIAQANESDEVKALGIKFVGVPGDDQGDPKQGVNAANTFVSDPALVGVVGHYNSGVSIPASKVYSQKNVVMVSPGSTNPALTTQGFANVFRVCTTDAVQGPVGADYAVDLLGFKTAYVIDDSTPYGEGLAAEFAKEFKAKGGTVVATTKTSDKDTDFNALVTNIKSANVDVVYYGGLYNAAALLTKQIADAGIKAPVMGGDGMYDQQLIELAGASQAEGTLATSVGLPIDQLAAGADFTAAYKEMFPGKQIAAFDPYGYDAANVIIAAVVKAAQDSQIGVAKLTTADGKKAIIANVAATKTTGITGDIAFDKIGDTTNKAITLYIVENGKWITKATPDSK
ncbi:MAG: branched-chain amino acid ABC transporter substrate-binding protein [Coriobacteriia bacterium]